MNARITSLLAILVAAIIGLPAGAAFATSSAAADETTGENAEENAEENTVEIAAPASALQIASRLYNARSTESAAPQTVQSQTVAPSHELSEELQKVLDLTNEVRAENGLDQLTHHHLLSDAAQAHSQDQADMNKLTHTGSDGSNPGDRIEAAGYDSRRWAENAAAGFPTAESVMNGWLNSPGHRTNIMYPDVTEIGLGIAFTTDGYPYWTQVFASPAR